MTNATASITIAFCTAFLASSFANAETQSPPNIVLILSDDQSYTDYGFMGHPEIETPHLDKLAKESALFRRGYVPTALCRPSLMTLITGLYSHQKKRPETIPRIRPPTKLTQMKQAKTQGNFSSPTSTGPVLFLNGGQRRDTSVTRAASGGKDRLNELALPKE
jgi:hypothetical protein